MEVIAAGVFHGGGDPKKMVVWPPFANHLISLLRSGCLSKCGRADEDQPVGMEDGQVG